MFLEKIEIQGFKSFASPVTLKFNRELTAIVGPNGSGKSNAADAVRWVLGEQSLKLLRGKKGEDVIFSGSDKKTRLGLAEVNLYLNNENKSVPLDYQNIVISRRIYRDGENEYFINKNKVRLIDVQLLLAKANFGQKTYSVIGQGMIDLILFSSPQERKEFFDEATGIRQYQIKKDQAINKLIITRENLIQSQNILKEIEPRFRFLNRQVKKLEKRREFEIKLRDLQKLFFSKALQDFAEQLNTNLSKLNEIEKDKAKIENEINIIQKKIEAEQQADTRVEAFNKLQQELMLSNQKKNSLEKTKTVLEGQTDLDLIKNGKIHLVWLKQRKEEILRKIKDQSEKIDYLKTDYQKKENEFKEKVKRQEDVISELKKIKEKLNQEGKVNKELLIDFDDIYHLQLKFLNNLNTIQKIEELISLKEQANIIKGKIEIFYQKIKNFQSKNYPDRHLFKDKIEELESSQDLLNREVSQQKMALTINTERLSLIQENLDGLKTEFTNVEKEEKDLESSADAKTRKTEIDLKISELEKELNQQGKVIQEIEQRIKDFNQSEDRKKAELFSRQKELQEKQYKLNEKNEKVNSQKIEIAKIETHMEELTKKINEEWVGHFEPLKEKVSLDLTAAGAEIERLKNQLNLIGGLDENINSEYQEVSTRYQFLKKEIDDLKEAFIGLEKVIQELDGRIKTIFSDNFQKINQNFSNYFKILFNGGRAKLILAKEKEPVEEENKEIEEGGEEELIREKTNEEDNWLKRISGRKTGYNIDIQATPPGKRLTSINMLSGGEKALTSIALICAIINNNPSPFVILDEVDAALDEANSFRFVKILDELTTKTQFICITHNRATIQKAMILYGVTMGDDGVSKILSLNLKEANKYIKV